MLPIEPARHYDDREADSPGDYEAQSFAFASLLAQQQESHRQPDEGKPCPWKMGNSQG